ncbi:insulinase family protein [bacterium]|nr:insulinase family protein [bacterium]
MMKRILRGLRGIVVFALILSFPLQAQEKASHFKLENGMEVFCYERHSLPLIHVVVGVNLGSKDETKKTSGMVHILEHCALFRGTETRSGTQVAQDVREHGAYFNAHTGRDLSLFELAVPSEYADWGLKNQKNILFQLKITQEELEKEKQIILEEINQVEDDPLKYATSLIYQNLFQSHPYQKPIYGNKKNIENATGEQLEKFHKKFFVPSNCVLSVVGDFSLEEMKEKIKSIFENIPEGNVSPRQYPQAPPLEKKIEKKKEMDVQQGYLVIGVPAPDYNHPDQYAVDLLTEIMGRGVKPLLNTPLQKRRVNVHSISMSYNSLKYGGVIQINVRIDPKNIHTAQREIIQYLKKTRRLNYSKNDYMGAQRFHALDYLKSAQNRIKHRFHQSQEKGRNLAVSLVRFMLLNKDPERGNYIDQIEKLSSTDIRKAAGNYLSTSEYVVVSILPQKKE